MANTYKSEKEMNDAMKQKLATTTDPVEKLRLNCLSRGCAGIKGLGRKFRIMDDSGDRQLNLEEFVEGCEDFGTKMSKEDLQAVFQTFDKDNSGSISYTEFLIAVRPKMSAARQKLVAKAFEKLDKTKDGVITVKDLEKVYDVSKHPKYITGESSKEQLLQLFLNSFEVKGHEDGKVTKEDFSNYYSGVSSSIDSDLYFDLMMRNAWKL